MPNTTHRITLEVCCGHLQSAINAAEAGVDRIELCSALPLGGLTPSPSLIRHTKRISSIPVFALVRPREGNFHYSQAEKSLYLDEVNACLDAGADGLVVGGLTTEDTVDLDLLEAILLIAKDVPITFHRAFDLVADPFAAMQDLVQLGIKRILTSGGQPTAFAGRDNLKRLIGAAGEDIIILPGSGIDASNVLELVKEIEPQELHFSAKGLHPSPTLTQAFDTSLSTTSVANIIAVMKLLQFPALPEHFENA